MTDHAEEQGMEAEALQAIFDTHFSIIKSGQWSVEIYPEMTADLDELDQLNHVGVKLLVELPTNYPEALPILDCQIIKGLVDEHQHEILALAREEATANEGVPSIFAITERVREWLVENNQKGLDDLSMHAQMIRKQQAKEKEKKQAEETVWESQEENQEFTAAELEEMAVRKRRAEGTPCDKENFDAWKARFEAEMANKTDDGDDNDDNDKSGGGPKRIKKHGSATVDRSDRITGYEYFKSRATNMEALEAAAEAAETQEWDDDEKYDNDDDELDVDEDLFEDDVDLDDLDFEDDDDDDDDDDDEEDVDI